MRSSVRHGAVALFATGLALAARAAPLEAQPPAQVHACYAPLAGLLYLIREPGLAQSCVSVGSIQHVPISWDKTGPKGDKGLAGEPGAAGAPGSAGPPGDKGPNGIAGERGTTGDKGATGDKGPPGVAGAVGDNGPTGDKGPAGEKGAAGDKGEAGDKGPPGDQGAVGDKGETGDKGLLGEKGPVGDKGPMGDKGETGDKGATGEKGPVGEQGPIGDKGLLGDKGAVGPAGPNGVGVPCDACVTTPIIADLAVTNAKLATITAPGKIANSATTATTVGSPVPANRIAQRDAAGLVVAGTVNGRITLTTALLLATNGFISVPGGAAIRRGGGDAPETASLHFGIGTGGSPFTVSRNVAAGWGSNRATTGGSSTAVGINVLTLGSSFGVVAVGAFAMDLGPFPGDRNTVLGFQAGRSISGSGVGLPMRNIVLGAQAGSSLFTHSNVIAIGRGTVTGTGHINLGTSGTHSRAFFAGIDNSAVIGVPLYVAADGQLGILASSARFKTGIRDVDHASAVLNRLRPVAYRYRPDIDARGMTQYGLIAEEVDRVAPDLVTRDSTREPYTVRYQMLVPLLVDAIQLRSARLTALREESATILRRLEQLESRVKP